MKQLKFKKQCGTNGNTCAVQAISNLVPNVDVKAIFDSKVKNIEKQGIKSTQVNKVAKSLGLTVQPIGKMMTQEQIIDTAKVAKKVAFRIRPANASKMLHITTVQGNTVTDKFNPFIAKKVEYVGNGKVKVTDVPRKVMVKDIIYKKPKGK